jgi:hypothetical protein
MDKTQQLNLENEFGLFKVPFPGANYPASRIVIADEKSFERQFASLIHFRNVPRLPAIGFRLPLLHVSFGNRPSFSGDPFPQLIWFRKMKFRSECWTAEICHMQRAKESRRAARVLKMSLLLNLDPSIVSLTRSDFVPQGQNQASASHFVHETSLRLDSTPRFAPSSILHPPSPDSCFSASDQPCSEIARVVKSRAVQAKPIEKCLFKMKSLAPWMSMWFLLNPRRHHHALLMNHIWLDHAIWFEIDVMQHLINSETIIRGSQTHHVTVSRKFILKCLILVVSPGNQL